MISPSTKFAACSWKSVRQNIRRGFSCAAFVCLAAGLHAGAAAPMRLWPGDAPGAHGQTPDDIPTLTAFLPEPGKGTGAALVVCPGGGYSGLSMEHEGSVYAGWLNARGIAAFVLKYRLGSHGYRHPAEYDDAARAMRLVRERAKEWGIDPHRIGIMGSSAGGHLAATVATHFQPNAKPADTIDRASARPDVAILCYPVITMGEHTRSAPIRRRPTSKRSQPSKT